jgi:hypothetical protein
VSLESRGEQVRVNGIDAHLSTPPLPKPDLGMDEPGRIGGMSAAFTELRHLLRAHGMDWDGVRARVSRPAADRLVLELIDRDDQVAASISLGRPHLDAVFLSEAFLSALAEAEPIIAEQQSRMRERLTGCTGWSYRQPERRAAFEFSARPTLEVPAQLLGTWNAADETWLWGWANSSVEPGCTELVERALRPEEQQPGFAVFWRERYSCEESFAGKVALLAGLRVGATGVYRGRAGGAWLYLALME